MGNDNFEEDEIEPQYVKKTHKKTFVDAIVTILTIPAVFLIFLIVMVLEMLFRVIEAVKIRFASLFKHRSV